MIKSIITVLISGFLLTACSHQHKSADTYTRIVFDPGELSFVASSLNERYETMSALYGNDKALASLSSADSLPAAGSVIKLVTWRYHDNPSYFGGKINGELLSVETVTAEANGKIAYNKAESSVQEGHSTELSVENQQQRIAYLMGYQPVTFP